MSFSHYIVVADYIRTLNSALHKIVSEVCSATAPCAAAGRGSSASLFRHTSYCADIHIGNTMQPRILACSTGYFLGIAARDIAPGSRVEYGDDAAES